MIDRRLSLGSRTAVAVIGAGSMGAGIAQLAAQAGHQVRLHDAKPGAAALGLERVAADLEGAVRRGKLEAAPRDAIVKRLVVVERIEELEGCGLAIEAIVEQLEAKQSLFRQLESVLGLDAVLATNTSSISITAVAQGLLHPERVIGWHFFNPAVRMKLVEIIPGVETDPALVPALHALSKAWGKTSVDAPNTPGFIVNRVARPYYAEGLRLLAERIAAAPTIDRLLREAGGFALGPFELMDLIGVDVNLSVTESVFQATAQDPRYAPNTIQQELVQAGRFGRKSGRGFYDYAKDAPAAVGATVAAEEPTGGLRHAPDEGLLQPLLARLRDSGVVMSRDDRLPPESLTLGDLRIALTDGRTAAQRAAETGGGAWALLDLACDFATAPLLGAAANGAGKAHLGRLAALVRVAGVDLVAPEDVAGLVVMRTVCCLANEAADLMTWAGARAADIDNAMRLGTAYPLGPLAWADRIGSARVVTVLANLQSHYGEVRYRRAPQLTRVRLERERFHG
jgi:3-hydroxybutyryl-CoA dehydrogenase